MMALRGATYRDNLVTPKLLVEAKADVRTTNRYEATPFSPACTDGDAAMVELLLQAGADQPHHGRQASPWPCIGIVSDISLEAESEG